MTDFISLKIKPTQFFKITHKNKVYVYISIAMSNHTSNYFYTVFLKALPPIRSAIPTVADAAPQPRLQLALLSSALWILNDRSHSLHNLIAPLETLRAEARLRARSA
jgi:hypothetical protein